MTALPAIASLTDSAATQGDAKNFFTNQRAFLSEVLGTTGVLKDARTAMQVPLHSKADKTGAYTVVAADQGKVLNCSGTWTLALTAAATLGDGFVVGVLNSGAGTITIDPSSTETIDGATTKTLGAGKLLLIYCNGSAFASIGSVDSASIVSALGYTPANSSHTHNYVSTDHGHNNVGSLCFARCTNTSALNPGATIAGSSLYPAGTQSYTTYSTALSGTWRRLGYSYGGSVEDITLYQRIS